MPNTPIKIVHEPGSYQTLLEGVDGSAYRHLHLKALDPGGKHMGSASLKIYPTHIAVDHLHVVPQHANSGVADQLLQYAQTLTGVGGLAKTETPISIWDLVKADRGDLESKDYLKEPSGEVNFKLGVAKKRIARDHILSHPEAVTTPEGDKTLHNKKMPPISNWDADPAKLKQNGHISANKLQQAIDQAPAQHWLYSKTLYGKGPSEYTKECDNCNGKGEVKSEEDCYDCSGGGKEHNIDHRAFDEWASDHECGSCGGRGYNLDDNANEVECDDCGGRKVSEPACGACSGSGLKEGRKCRACQGHGTVIPPDELPDCQSCGGSGAYEGETECPECEGEGDVPSEPDPDDLQSQQQHSASVSKVFKLDLSREHVQALKNAGVWDTFKKLYALSESSNHPVNKHYEWDNHGHSIKTPTLGWVRFTGGQGDTEPIHVDEVQSDFGQDVGRKYENELKAAAAKKIKSVHPQDLANYKQIADRKLPDRLVGSQERITGSEGRIYSPPDNGVWTPQNLQEARHQYVLDHVAQYYGRGQPVYLDEQAAQAARDKYVQDELADFERDYPKAHRAAIDSILFGKIDPNAPKPATPEELGAEYDQVHAPAIKADLQRSAEKEFTVDSPTNADAIKARQEALDALQIATSEYSVGTRRPINLPYTEGVFTPKNGAWTSQELQQLRDQYYQNLLSNRLADLHIYPNEQAAQAARDIYIQDKLGISKRQFVNNNSKLPAKLPAGKDHPNELIAEAFLQHLRERNPNMLVHWPTGDFKAPFSLARPDDPRPAHFNFTYGELPKKVLGFSPAKYGEIPTQTGPWAGEPMFAGRVRKAEKLKGVKRLGKAKPNGK